MLIYEDLLIWIKHIKLISSKMPGKQLFIIIYFLFRLTSLNPFIVILSKDYE